jgi:uncharacterized protein (TIGR03067 family)
MNLLAALAVVTFAAAPVPKDVAPKPPVESIEGEWRAVLVIHGGKPHNPNGPPAVITIKGDTMTIKEGDGNAEVVTFTLDPKSKPATIDLREARGGKPGRPIQGIYLLEKDKLTVCFGMDGADRPKEFKSEPNTKTGMFTLERVKK